MTVGNPRGMTAAELLAELQGIGVSVAVDGDGLVLSPFSKLTPELRDAVKEHKAELLSLLERTIPPLPWQLERLVAAASSGLLPTGMVRLADGNVPDLNSYTLSWAAAYLTGDREHCSERLWDAYRAWHGDKALFYSSIPVRA